MNLNAFEVSVLRPGFRSFRSHRQQRDGNRLDCYGLRASLVGGLLEIETEVGRGTMVFERIPLAFGNGEPSAAGHTSIH
jgi:hypothetical protein